MEKTQSRQLNRRQALKVLSAAGIGSAAAFILPGVKRIQAANQNQELRIDVTSDPNSLDLIRFNETHGQRVWRLVHNQLLRWTNDKQIEPDLATGMPEVSDDRLTYTLKLRQDVKWHDGQPFDASDVKYTYDQIRDPENSSVWRSHLLFVDEVLTPDPYTVVVKLKSPFTPIIFKFAHLPIISSKIPYKQNETYARNLVGTGPYRFISWKKGVGVELVENKDYFRPGQPGIPRISFQTVKEEASRIANLVNNNTHILPDTPPNQVDLIRQLGAKVQIMDQNTTRVYIYPCFTEGRPTTDLNLRKAIAWAIDRQAILEQVYYGAGVPAATYLSSGSLYFDEELGTYFGSKPDVEKAKAYLAKADIPKDYQLELIAHNVSDLVDTATIIQSNLRDIGLNVRLSALEFAGWVPKLLKQEFDLIIYKAPATDSAGFGPDYPYAGLLSTSPGNFNKFKDPKMDELLKAAVAAPLGEPARAAWRAVQAYDVQTLGNIQIATVRYIESYSQQLKNYEPHHLGAFWNLPKATLG